MHRASLHNWYGGFASHLIRWLASKRMSKRILRVVLTIGLVPLWMLGMYGGILISIPGGVLLDSWLSEDKVQVRWMQPAYGESVTSIRVSNSERLHQCGILALTNNGQIYLYTLPSTEDTSLKATNVTEEFCSKRLPRAFRIRGVNPLAIEDVPSANTRSVTPEMFATLPRGEIVDQGHCQHNFEDSSSGLDAVLLRESGLWVHWYKSDLRLLFSIEDLLPFGSIACLSAILVTSVTIFLYIRIWIGYR